MDFGLILIIRNPPKWRRPDHEVYQSYVDNAVLGEKLGFSHIWTSEHHFMECGWSPSQFPILATIAARTERIRVGTLIYLLALHNPVQAAEDAATVDILSNGRLDFAVGPGGSPDECRTFGVPYGERRARMHEGLALIRRCFEEDAFDHDGKYYHFKNIRMTTRPVQKPFPLWVAAFGPKALTEAGAGGYHLAATPPAEMQEFYDDALRKAGHDPRQFKRSMHQIVHVAETTEKAWDEAEPHIHYYMEKHYAMIEADTLLRRTSAPLGASGKPDLSVPPLGELRKTGRGPYGPAFIGSPDAIIKQLEELFRTHPMDEMSPSLGLPGMDPKVARHSMELFAREVMPHFKNFTSRR
ncbi:MAG TPA: LLM class flavin-dependent oxidoreductase [Candidatus Binataceae bacterium]|nr:LLM class flavin-dependent oxidoreductase [Candidatus Binataceae bacterium]